MTFDLNVYKAVQCTLCHWLFQNIVPLHNYHNVLVDGHASCMVDGAMQEGPVTHGADLR